MKKSASNFHGPVVLIGGPVVVLVLIGFAGLSSMRKAALTDARSMAQGSLEKLVKLTEDRTEMSDWASWTFPLKLPVPPAEGGEDASTLEKALIEGDTATLSGLALKGAGLTASGLPVRTVACLALLEAGAEVPKETMEARWPVVHASMLSELWIRRLEEADSPWAPRSRITWERDEAIRMAFWNLNDQKWSANLRDTGFQRVGGEPFWVFDLPRKEDDAARIMSEKELREWLNAQTGEFWQSQEEWLNLSGINLWVSVDDQGSPASKKIALDFASMGLNDEGEPIGKRLQWLEIPPGGKRLEVAKSGPFTFVTSLESPDVLFASYNRIAVFVQVMMLVAAVSSGLGLLLAHRSLKRERKLNELKSQFVSSVSHELRAPVGSMRLMADALDQGKVSGEKTKEFHRLMSREGARLSSMIENVLDFARIEQGRKAYTLSETDIEALVRETVQLMAPLADEKEVKIEAQVDPPDRPPKVDPEAIQQALINLVDNAVKFSPEGETVTVSFGEDEKNGDWVLSVADRGPGIPKGSRDDIFKRFHRLGNELRRETQGAGIGLSLVEHVAKGHGGSIKVLDEPGGATLELRIPYFTNGSAETT